jgi:glycosyltransferase involved in cell wall biosynthesis
MQLLVSILIPCYNAEKYLEETLNSALSQTWQNIEIIVVDDGSTDNSLSIAKRFASNKVKVISQENRGASAARNRALKEAQGDFIQYLDADDLLNPIKIEDQLLLLQSSSLDFLAVCATIYFWNGKLPEQGVYEAGFPFIVDGDNPLEWLLTLLGADDNRGGMVHPAAWLISHRVIRDAGCWDEKLSLDDDGEYFTRVVLASKGIRRASSALTYYRKYRNGSNLSAGKTEKHYLSALYSLDSKARHILALTDSPRAKKTLARCYMEQAFITYPQYSHITEQALQRVKELGGTNHVPIFGTWKGELIKKLFGWKIAKMLQFRIVR